MKNTVKYGIRAVVFCSILLVLLIIASQLVVPKDNTPLSGMRHYSANGILSEPEDTIDVLILGDSESYRSMIPMKMWEDYGITSFCCGSPAQRLFESVDFLDKAYKTQNPKIIVLETDTFFRKYSYDDMLLFEAGLALPVFDYHNRWKTLNSDDFGGKISYTNPEYKKGYQFKVLATPAVKKNYMKKTKAVAKILDQNKHYVRLIKDYCDEKGAKLVLVSTPSIKNWNMRKHNAVAEIAKEIGVEYIDTNTMIKDLGIDWETDTYDKGDHMNHAGAEKVTDFLGKYLIESGLISSHKDDEKYSYWNSQLEMYRNEVAQAYLDTENQDTEEDGN